MYHPDSNPETRKTSELLALGVGSVLIWGPVVLAQWVMLELNALKEGEAFWSERDNYPFFVEPFLRHGYYPALVLDTLLVIGGTVIGVVLFRRDWRWGFYALAWLLLAWTMLGQVYLLSIWDNVRGAS